MEVEFALLKGSQEHSDVIVNCLPFIIGRCRTANFIVAHVNVSRNHCRIVLEEGNWKIIDSSSSGTFINGELVGKENWKILNEGDVIRFGPAESNLSWSFHPLNTGSFNNRREENSLNNLNFKPQVQVLVGLPAEKQMSKCEFSLHSEEKVKPCIGELLKDSELKYAEEKKLLEKVKENFCQDIEGDSKKPSGDSLVESHLPVSSCENVVRKVDSSEFCINQTKTESFKHEEGKGKAELLEKLKEIKKTEKVLFQKISENEKCLFSKVHGEESPIKKEVQSDEQCSFLQEPFEKETLQESRTLSTQYILEELEQVKSVLSDLENKNSALEGKLAEVSNTKTESCDAQSNLLENFADLMETELQCTICSELFVTAVTLACTHTFCQFCINQWKKKQKTCPICRKKITNETRSLVVDNYIDKMVENLSADLKNRRATIITERQEESNPKKRKRTGRCK